MVWQCWFPCVCKAELLHCRGQNPAGFLLFPKKALIPVCAVELLLCEGNNTARNFIVADSFWSRNGCESFIYEKDALRPRPRAIGDKDFLPRTDLDVHGAQLPVDDRMLPTNERLRAPARLGGSVMEDPGSTLV